MLDIVRFDSPARERFASRFSVDHLVLGGGCEVKVFDASESTLKSFESDLSKQRADAVIGCEWIARKDHMDYPKNAMRIQTARAIRDASCIYLFTPEALSNPKRFAVARFNAKVLAQARTPVAFVSLAATEEQLASPRDLDAIGRILGFSDETIARGRTMLEKLPTTRFERAFSVELPRSQAR